METHTNLVIIYSAKDESSTTKMGWAFSFHRFLELLLGRLLRKKVSITLCEINDFEIDKIYKSDTLLIPIASEPLLNTNIFKEEIKKFHEKCIHKEKNNLSWSSRIFKVFKYPSKSHYLLDFLSSSPGYNFYHKDPITNDVVKYDDFTSPDSQKTFWMRLYDLAYDISKVLQDLQNVQDEIEAIKEQINKENIYLAAVGTDLENERSIIKRELQRSGFQVLPENNIPGDLESALRQIKADIQKCVMTVHLIGADPGKIKGTNSSILELQLRVVSELLENEEKMDGKSFSLPLGRVIWVLPSIDKISVKQKIFIDNLKKDPVSLKNADLLESNIEELKGFISNRISNYRSRVRESEGYDKTKKVIYLICDTNEAKKYRHIEKFLNDNGFDVISSNFEGSPDEIRNRHMQNLRQCDGTLIYFSGDNSNWMKSKLLDISKALGMEREKPMGPRAVIIDSEQKFDDFFKSKQDTLIFYNKGNFSTKALEPFLEKLQE